jgi:hypothetical protein
VVRTKYALAFLRCVAVRLWIIPAGTPAVRGQIALFPIPGQAVAGESVAAAVITLKFDDT